MRKFLLIQIIINHSATNIFLKVQSLILKNQNYIAQDINIDFKKDIFGNKNNDQDLKDFPRQARMVLQQLIKVFLPAVKKMINALRGRYKQIKLHTTKIRDK